jgi:5-methylthioribose kinase
VETETEFDIEQPGTLVQYLKTRGLIDPQEEPSITVLTGGVSNRVVMVARANHETWVVKQALPKLRVPVEWFSSPARVHREAAALRWLAKLEICVPEFRFEDVSHHLLAMDAVAYPHENWKTMLLAGRLRMEHILAFATLLADIHLRSHARSREMEVAFGDSSFFESLRIEPYYLYTADRVPAARAFMLEVAATTRAHRVCLVHGDFSPKNVLVHNDELVLLDHEVAHFGDPAFDIGFSTTHLLSKANHLPEHRAEFRDAALGYWRVYWDRVGASDMSSGLEGRAVRSILACMLSRVAGRSRFEYLSEAERDLQQRVVVGLMADPPTTVRDLVARFIGSL